MTSIKNIPIQMRGPSPKLKNEQLLLDALFSSENLSGSNFSGSEYKHGSFWIPNVDMTIGVPFSIRMFVFGST